MTGRALPPPLPSQVTAVQRERAMMWQFIAVGLGLASGFYLSRRGWDLPLNVNAVIAAAAPLAAAWFLNPYDRIHACLLGVLLFLSVGLLFVIQPTPIFVIVVCASIAAASFVFFTLKRRSVARALLLLLCLVLMAVKANRIFGPWVQLI